MQLKRPVDFSFIMGPKQMWIKLIRFIVQKVFLSHSLPPLLKLPLEYSSPGEHSITNIHFYISCFVLFQGPRGSVIQDASVSASPLAREAVVRLGHLTTILQCFPSQSVTKLPFPRHPLPLRRAPSAVRLLVILTVIQDAVTKPTNRPFRKIPLARTIWDITGIRRGILARLWAVPLLVPRSANQVNYCPKHHKTHDFLTNEMSSFILINDGQLKRVRGTRNEFLGTQVRTQASIRVTIQIL